LVHALSHDARPGPGIHPFRAAAEGSASLVSQLVRQLVADRGQVPPRVARSEESPIGIRLRPEFLDLPIVVAAVEDRVQKVEEPLSRSPVKALEDKFSEFLIGAEPLFERMEGIEGEPLELIREVHSTSY
jgi:hypothetical protein